jgi:hypothetical protein
MNRFRRLDARDRVATQNGMPLINSLHATKLLPNVIPDFIASVLWVMHLKSPKKKLVRKLLHAQIVTQCDPRFHCICFVGNASQKPKKKACEEIVACPNCHPM